MTSEAASPTEATSSNVLEVQLDRTTMHPQGGGQPTDVGFIVPLISSEEDNMSHATQKLKVSKVTLDRITGIVTHLGTLVSIDDPSANPPSTPELWNVGQPVHVVVDAEERRILSECHTAGHVVDAAMARCNFILPPSKGYHFLDGPYVEYKGTIPANNRDKLLIELQNAFQDLVDEDIPTKIETLTQNEAQEVCSRVQENFRVSDYADGDVVRIVTVAGWPCPCGGTHVRSTQMLKERCWGIVGIKCKKGIVRIRYGMNAGKV
jgi:Ser-tRNA(Ala) deacylase AlaX